MSGQRLLVLDDEVNFGAFVRRVGQGLGFTVEVTTKGSAFQEIYKRFDPTVIVLDILMPDMDGIEIIQWLIAQNCSARILIISGFNPHYAQMAEELGTVAGKLSVRALRKPIDLADLEAALQPPAKKGGSRRRFEPQLHDFILLCMEAGSGIEPLYEDLQSSA